MRLPDSVLVAFLWRYVCHAVMIGLALLNEARPAPSLPDVMLDLVPRVDCIAQHNYHLWLVCYLPPALWLWRQDRAAFVHFLYVGGVLSLLRGLTVGLTGLGPVEGPDLNAGVDGATLWQAWLALVNPVEALMGDAPHVHLTKDLFFSGHTATTFLLWLYCRGRPVLGWITLVAHVFIVSVVFAARLHYTVDVIGAWAITYSLHGLAVRRWPPGPSRSKR